MENIIEREIKQATSAFPVTSTRLIQIVKDETRQTISARRIRRIVARLRDDKRLPILATKRDPQGYYLASSVAEVESYEFEIKSHALRELKTISQIKADYFGQSQQKLTLI